MKTTRTSNIFVIILQTVLFATRKTTSTTIPLKKRTVPVPSRTHYYNSQLEEQQHDLTGLHAFTWEVGNRNEHNEEHVYYQNRRDEEQHDNSTTTNNSTNHDEDYKSKSKTKPWGKVLGATILVNLVTLTGVIFLIPCVSKSFWKNILKSSTAESSNLGDETTNTREAEIQQEEAREANIQKLIDIFIPPFAAGALLSTVVFLVIPESIMALQVAAMMNVSPESKGDHYDHEDDFHNHIRRLENHNGEHDDHKGEFLTGAVWRFGAALLGGFMLPIMLAVLFPQKWEHDRDDSCVADTTVAVLPDEQAILTSKLSTAEPDSEHGIMNSNNQNSLGEEHQHEGGIASPISINYPLVLSILIGDAFHNFCDGVFIGIAFLGCDTDTAITIMLITLYHEIAQELADYFLLTKHANLTPLKALLLNFIAGLSVILGGLLVLALEISDLTIGVILALAAGVYIYIAACECLPRVNLVVETWKERVLTIPIFLLGSVPVGLALLNHSHCNVQK